MRLPKDRILHIDTELAGDEVRVVMEWRGELVRCKDCRHYNDGDCDEMPKLVNPDDYCSYGERSNE